MDIASVVVLLLLITMSLAWLFFGKYIVRFFGWETDENPSWMFGHSKK